MCVLLVCLRSSPSSSLVDQVRLWIVHRGSYIKANVLLNLLNELGERLAEHFTSFSQRV